MASKASKVGLSAGQATVKIDAYLAGLPPDQRAALLVLRKVIAAAAPETDEGLSYGVPAFRYRNRPLVSHVAAKAHCSFYPMSPKVVDDHRPELGGFSLDKGTIRFTPDHPIPADLVKRIVRARIAETDATESANGRRRAAVSRLAG
ncbi:MAG: iron chaperone [Candidatus Limnocylindria bacterium]